MTDQTQDSPPNVLAASVPTASGGPEQARNDLELFIHVSGLKPDVVLATAEETLRDVLGRIQTVESLEGYHLFVGECTESLTEAVEIDDGVDEHAAVDIDLKLSVLDLERHRHVHAHKCHRIAVEVNFSNQTKKHRFAPNTTVAVVTDWARSKFPIDAALAGEYVLQLCKSTVQPRSTEHLGDIVPAGTCSICFDLVKEVTPKG
ncbi:hypothetical protein GGD63_006588 [Bradyrhizobium sp. cir1]|uniref:hypothetical protein n=1 Tax=Bradyrhizobium sp. cir1 TaxID=1445730 RepID=UPI00160637DE|nr:hypothetical protein [Bradyrhizobium sp. cir1]MBB4373760.1 hypothetical protein [Bradyrhizobium sp. cir1]